MTLHVPADALGLATLCADFARGLRDHALPYHETTVEVRTLADVCDQYASGRRIDFLKIDVEGHERQVLAGADWNRHRPVALVVEATVNPEAWEPSLLAAGYLRAAFDGLNLYFIRREDAHLAEKLRAPANCLDDYIPFEHWQTIENLRRERDQARAEVESLLRLLWEERTRAEALQRALAAASPHPTEPRRPRGARLRIDRGARLLAQRFRGFWGPTRRPAPHASAPTSPSLADD